MKQLTFILALLVSVVSLSSFTYDGSNEDRPPGINYLFVSSTPAAGNPLPYEPFLQPCYTDIVLDISAGERITYLNDNNPNGAEGKTFVMLLEYKRGKPTPPAQWTINEMRAVHDMHFEFHYGDTMEVVNDDLGNAWIISN